MICMKTGKRILGSIALTAVVLSASAQEVQRPAISFNGYIEAYYAYDFNKPVDNNRPAFFYSHNRHNEFNLNLGYLKASYTSERTRAAFAIAAGTYINANYAAEPGVLKNIYEANAGIKLAARKNLWLDAGIFSSHIGFESAVSKDCATLTRSILAENSPYYESGVKLSYSNDNGKWFLSALALNGWQRVKRLDGNSMMSCGTQVQYKPSGKVLLDYSNFIGTDKPDSIRAIRTYHNLYGQFGLSDKLLLTLGLDLGTEEDIQNGGTNTWISPVGILKYSLNEKWTMAARGEYYEDKNGVIIFTGTSNGFKTSGFSLNIDYAPAPNVLARIEGRYLHSKDAVFTKGGAMSQNNTFVTGSIAVSF